MTDKKEALPESLRKVGQDVLAVIVAHYELDHMGYDTPMGYGLNVLAEVTMHTFEKLDHLEKIGEYDGPPVQELCDVYVQILKEHMQELTNEAKKEHCNGSRDTDR